MDARHYTQAIKSKLYFAPILCKLFCKPSILPPLDPKYKTFDLGFCHKQVFSVVLLVLVGHSSRIFFGPADDFNIVQLRTGGYSIVILYTFVPKLPITQTSTQHFFTRLDEEVIDPVHKAINTRLHRGFLESECVDLFKNRRQFLIDDTISKIKDNIPNIESTNPHWEEYIRIGGYFRKGKVNNAAFKNYHAEVKKRGLI
jgi:hypothetical protein